MKVLMLGWELAPHISGGLGVACASLARGLTEQGTQVLFLLPRARGDEQAGSAIVRGCDPVPHGPPAAQPPDLRRAELDSPLRPYMSRSDYERQRAAAPHSATGARFRGGYGASLLDEVARFADVVEGLCPCEDFDLIHAHDWMTFAAGRRAKARSARPLVCHVHSTERDRRPFDPDAEIVREEQRAFDDADRIVCVSAFAADALCAHYEVDRGKLRTVRNALDLHELPHPPRGAPGAGARAVRERPPRILFLGRLTSQKGPLVFLEAAAKVLARLPGAEAVVCGEGELLEPCRLRARELGISDRVHFPGFLTGGAVRRMYASSDVFVLPSVSEPFGLTPLEALACGVPALVSRQSGVAEVLRSSIQFDHWDVDDLAEKILAVLRFPSLRDQLVSAGRADLRGLGWDTSAFLLRRVYEELVA